MTKYSLPTIGTVERVDFPSLGLTNVPAKIDTGADSSAIWASDVRLDSDGMLSFVLFDASSKFYSGERVETDSFRSSNVKNTSGAVESRYKVQLLVQIGERRIKAWFNLSDRSRMKYPVLIGRRLLHNKFLVDVSRRHLHSDDSQPRHVLVLGAPERRVGEFLSEVAARTEAMVEFHARSFRELLFTIEANDVTVGDETSGRDLADYDLVYFKTHRRNYEFAISAAEYLEYRHVPVLDREISQYVAYDKLAEMMRLALRGLPVPLTFCASRQLLAERAGDIVKKLGCPFVCKEINADHGRKNYLLESAGELREVLAQADSGDRYMVQRYIRNKGYFRALVLGSNLALMMQRQAVGHADPRRRHLNNPAGSANARLLPPEEMPAEAKELALAAAQTMRRQVAGVDLVQDDRTKEWFVLEVNSAPQIRTGANVEEKTWAFAKFIDFALNR